MEINTTTDIKEVEWDFFIHDRLATAIFLSITSVVGTVGNINVLAVYSRLKRSKLRLFILVLAVNDLLGSSITIPLSIVDIRYSMTMTSSVYCKFIRFVTYQITMTSALLLSVVAFERYRKVCYPFGSQMTFRQMKIGCIVPIVMSTTLAVPTFYLYGSVPPDVNLKLHPEMAIGKMCGPFRTEQTIPYFSCLLLVGTTVVIFEIFCYVSIAISIIRWKSYKRYLLNQKSEAKEEDTPLLEKEQNKKYKRYQNSNLMKELGQDEEERTKEMAKMDKAARLAIMFMFAAIFSYVGYIPVIVNNIVQAANSKAYTDLLGFLESSITLLNRLYFLNNIVNPIMYGLMDQKFRQTCKEMYSSCF